MVFTSRVSVPSRGINFNCYIMIWMLHDGFRPLTGIKFNIVNPFSMLASQVFVPLTGINSTRRKCRGRRRQPAVSVPHGDKFQLISGMAGMQLRCFRPLTGINSTIWLTILNLSNVFLSPHGDKFQHGASYCLRIRKEFPSPHGDKFQPDHH